MRTQQGSGLGGLLGAPLIGCVVACGLLEYAGAAGVGADAGEALSVLKLRSGDVDLAGKRELLGGAGALTNQGDSVRVLVLREPMTRALRADFAEGGVRVLDYLPGGAFLCEMRATTKARLAGMPAVKGVYAYEPAWKLAPELARAIAPQPNAHRAQETLALTVHCFEGVARVRAIATIAALPGARIIASSDRSGQTILNLSLLPAQFAALAALPEVQWAEPLARFSTRSNSTTRWVVQSDTPNFTPLYNRGVVGAGQVIGIIDDGFSPTHCSFLDRQHPIGPLHRKVLALNSGVYNLHGLHVACTAAGDDNNPLSNNRGIASGAKIVFNTFPFFGEQFVYDQFELHRTQGAFVHSNSWGNAGTREYDSTCRAVDRFSREHEDNLVLFAVADAQLTLNPENAKSCLAVSLGQNAPNQNSPCVNGLGQIYGPTSTTTDGRRKPEVVAPGCAIISAVGETGCASRTETGTSMATPAVAGVATLFRQYFADGFYPSGVATVGDRMIPSGALLRAMMVNCAADASNDPGFPSQHEGWGRVLADTAAYFPGDVRGLIVTDIYSSSPAALDTGDVHVLRVLVGSANESFKATLSFTDAPAAIGAAVAPVNDLDLVVTSPTGSTYYGNAFAGGVSISASQGGTPDAINSVEQVLVAHPQQGVWTVQVRGMGVPMGPQGFGLVVTGDVGTVVCRTIDFNGDGVYPDSCDVEDFLSVFAGGQCCGCNGCDGAGCDSIDFNSDGIFPDMTDLDAFLRVFAGGEC